MEKGKKSEIFKEYDNEMFFGTLTYLEVMALADAMKGGYSFYLDPANGYLAMALPIDREDADRVVSELNVTEKTNHGTWYLGDEDEEYVFVE